MSKLGLGFDSPFKKMERRFVICLLLALPFCTAMLAQNVGIGTAAPAQKLHVNGNLRFDGALMPNGNAGARLKASLTQRRVGCDFRADDF